MTDPPDFFPLIVRGRGGIITDYDGGALTVRFRRSRRAAGRPTSYNDMAEGSAAWVDRPLHDDEPTVLKQQMDDADAATTIQQLREGGFWMFLCRNTFAGEFEVFRSEPTSAEFNL